MVWLFAIAGLVLGAVVGEAPGMIVGLVVGWTVGMILKAMLPVKPNVSALEKRVAALEVRLAKLEGMPVIPAEPVIPSEPVVPAEAGTQPEPEREPAAPEPVTPVEAGLPPPRERQEEPRERKERKPNFIVAWFTGGNTIVRVGLVVLFFGLAFLVKYGVDHEMIPVEIRVAAVAMAGLALLVLGWRLREKRKDYALSMQGGGIAVLYLTVFGSLKLYHLLPAGMAFGLLVVIAVASAVLAVKQDSLALATFGAAGGFLAPIFASTGGGSHVLLFSYYLLLNASIVGVAYYRAWRVLNVVGFLFTFLIGLAWGLRSYRTELFESTEPFLIAFFLMYVAIAILFARQQVAAYKNYVDGTITFGVPIAAFGLQAGMMRDSEFGLAFSSIAAGALYILLATVLRRFGDRWKMLCESFLALGVVFTTLAIPLALDARWTSAAWALEGAAIVWIGTRQRRKVATGFGAFLELAAGGAFFRAYPTLPDGLPLLDAAFVGAVLISVAGILTYRVLRPVLVDKHKDIRHIASAFFIWGVLWWLFALDHEVDVLFMPELQLNAMLAFLAATMIVYTLMGERQYWEAARWPTWLWAPALVFFALLSLVSEREPMDLMGWVAWPFAFIVHFALLARQQGAIPMKWERWLHALGVIALAMIGAQELEWIADHFTASETAWSLASCIVVPAALILWISSHRSDTAWPVGRNLVAYRKGAVVPLVIAMFLWSLYINFEHAGSSDPLPYLPFLNAIDLGHVFAGLALLSAWRATQRSGLALPWIFRGKLGMTIVAGVTFFWLNAVLLRTLHHWTGVAYDFDPLWDSVVVQASLSIFWAALALGLMLFATRKAMRPLWIIGASLMAVVVVKLVLVDLGHLGGIERIVSFIGVGVLMLVIGYFSPVPPRSHPREGGGPAEAGREVV